MRWSVKLRCQTGSFCLEGMGEASFKKLHCAFQSDDLWGEKKMDVIRHKNVGVEKEVSAVAGNGIEEKLSITVNLEYAPSLMSCGCDEVSAGDGGADRNRHWAIIVRTLAA